MQQSIGFGVEMEQLNLMIGLINGSHQVNQPIALGSMTRTGLMLLCPSVG
jgi:hypothetical protein